MARKAGQKRKKAEKAKTQLKTSMKASKQTLKKKGKKLPKGLNESKVNVTFKSLHLQEQHHEMEEVSLVKPVTKDEIFTISKEDKEQAVKRLKGLKELLGKLNNPTLSVRLDGLKGLKDWLKFKPESLEDEASAVVSKVAALAYDVEPRVRNETASVIGSLMRSLNSAQCEPVVTLISVHLKVALSHVDSGVQRDALKIVDNLILDGSDRRSAAVNTLTARELLPFCLEQITTTTTASSKSAGNSTTSKVGLSSGLDKNVDSAKWREIVLERMEKMFSALTSGFREEGDDNSMKIFKMEENSESEFQGFFPQGQNQVPLTLASMVENRYESNSTSKDEKSSDMHEFCVKLIPLLLDIWAESCSTDPNAKKNKGQKSNPSNNRSSDIPISRIQSLCHISAILRHISVLCGVDAFSAFENRFGSVISSRLPFKTISSNPEDRRKISGINLKLLIVSLQSFRSLKENSTESILKSGGANFSDLEQGFELFKLLTENLDSNDDSNCLKFLWDILKSDSKWIGKATEIIMKKINRTSEKVESLLQTLLKDRIDLALEEAENKKNLDENFSVLSTFLRRSNRYAVDKCSQELKKFEQLKDLSPKVVDFFTAWEYYGQM